MGGVGRGKRDGGYRWGWSGNRDGSETVGQGKGWGTVTVWGQRWNGDRDLMGTRMQIGVKGGVGAGKMLERWGWDGTGIEMGWGGMGMRPGMGMGIGLGLGWGPRWEH